VTGHVSLYYCCCLFGSASLVWYHDGEVSTLTLVSGSHSEVSLLCTWLTADSDST